MASEMMKKGSQYYTKPPSDIHTPLEYAVEDAHQLSFSNPGEIRIKIIML